MTGRDVVAYIDRVERAAPFFGEPIEVAPFVDWFNSRLADGADYAGLLGELGWSDDGGAGARRMYAYRSGDRLLIERGLVEDALDHADVGWWEVYGEDDDEGTLGHDAYCCVCAETVTARADGTCPWCDAQTGGHVDDPPDQRPARARPLRAGDPQYGVVCGCGATKSKQARECSGCRKARGWGGGFPRPGNGLVKMTNDTILRARKLYLTGMSMSHVAVEILDETDYERTSRSYEHAVENCTRALYGHFRRRGWKLRPQRSVSCAARNTRHGRKKRNVTPEEVRAYRRWLAEQRGRTTIRGLDRPMCDEQTRSGLPCGRRALADSTKCYSHDPRYADKRRATRDHLARGREIRNGTMIPAGPFVEFVAAVRREHGLAGAAELLGMSTTTVWAYSKGVTTSTKTPLTMIGANTVRRWAAAAGTTAEAIYAKELEHAVA